MLKSPPVNAGDADSSPGLGGSHMPQSNWVRAPQLLGLCSGACEPQLLRPTCLEPVLRNVRGHCNEGSAHSGEEWPPLTATREKPARSNKDPTQP